MKVIKEIEQDGDLKGIIFYNNNVSDDERFEIDRATRKTYDNFFKTNKLSKDDLINLKRHNEISIASLSGNLIKINSDLSYEIKNKLNDAKTEWVMYFIVWYKDKEVYIGHSFEESLEYLHKGIKMIDWILNSEKLEMFDLYT